MTLVVLLIVLASQVSSVKNDGNLAPPEARKTTYSISSKASAMIDPLDGRTLADDKGFVRTLTEVLKNPDFADIDKADAFFLMRKKFDWAFIGAASIPPGYTYDRVFGMFLQSYREYRKGLGNGHDVKWLLEIAAFPEPENIVRASSALLLAAVLDPEATRETVVALSDPQLVAATVAPPIAIHHLALAAALCDVGDEGFGKLAALATRFPFEESQEDILLALAYSDSEPNRALIQQFAEQHAPKKFDNAVQLALTLLRFRQKPEEFKPWVESVAAKSETEQNKKSILDWAEAKPKPIGPYHPQRGILKLWDGFTMSIYNDGSQLTFGDNFSGFMSRG